MNVLKRCVKFASKKENSFLFFTFLLLGVLFTASGLIVAFFFSPDDYLQGKLVRIMYIHVPCAWLSLFLYMVMALLSTIYLTKKIPWCDLIAANLSEVVFILTLITIITGSIWGKPAWGSWWVWDARLSSMLLLLFLISSYIMVRKAYNGTEVGAKICSVLSVVGAINIPIIKFSVNLWNTLHQPSSVFRIDGPSIHYSMLLPMLLMFLGMLFLCTFVVVVKIRSELYIRKARGY